MNSLTSQHQMAYQAHLGKRKDGRGRVRCNCPFCITRKGSADRRLSFTYYHSGFYKCYRCGIKSFDDLHDHEGSPIEVARGLFRQSDGPRGFIPLWHSYPPSLQPAVDYLERRGVYQEQRAIARVGVCVTGPFAHRIVVPHLDPNGTWWGWSARIWEGTQGVLKYKYPPHMSRDKLYNGQILEVEDDRPVMVVEGVFDSLLYLPHAVACLGQPTAEHFNLLVEAKRPIAMCMDGDRWYVGKRWAQRLKRKGISVGWVRLPPGEDPNSIDAESLRDAADRCIGGTTCLMK